MNIAPDKKVESLTLNQTTTLTVGEGAIFSNPVVINKDSTIISKVAVPAIIKNNVKVTVKAANEDVGTIITGTGSQDSVDLVLKAALNAAEKAIKDLPTLKDIRIVHKDGVLNAKALVENVKVLDSTAKVQGEELLADLLEKINYLGNEKDSDIWFTQVSPNTGTGFFKDSKVTIEGYFYNVKYLDKVLIGDVEADIEYIPNWEFKNSSGRVIYTGPAFKYSKEIDYKSGYYQEKVTAISESGRKNNTTARFFVDSIAPQLDIVVNGVNEKYETTNDFVEVTVTMKDNFYNLRLLIWGSEEFSQERSPDSASSFITPANVTETITINSLDQGENEITFELEDALGNITTKTIIIPKI